MSGQDRTHGGPADARSPGAALGGVPMVSRWLAGAKVLAADDDERTGELLSYALSAFGAEARVVTSGAACLTEVDTFAPDLIILDALMPGMDGFEVAARLREGAAGGPALTRPPILMLTGLVAHDAMANGFASGADDFLTKPYAMNELVVRCANLVRLRRAHERVAGLLRSREDLANAVVHDLRSPLSVILMNATVIADVDRTELPSLVADIVDGAKRMSKLLDELLLVARSEARGLTPVRSWVSMEELLAEATVLAERLPQPPHGSARITASGAGRAWLDRDLMLRVLDNLLGNALKYGLSEVPLEICLRGEVVDGAVMIEVADNGPGIEAALRSKLFSRFGAGDHPGAHGLGLHFCRLAVEAHGGTLDLVEGPSRGARFRITIPQAEA